MSRSKYTERVRAAEARLAQERREPGIKPPGASEMGVPRRFGENPARADGSRYRPTAATQSARKPDPYWHQSGELIYPD